ncbi:ABC transporter permease [Gordonia aurantiaca]|uniref:ABC transporter permease n=1 Tax=Gordonia sp. B21 TaxID=3151852 RepID=UPI0032674310
MSPHTEPAELRAGPGRPTGQPTDTHRPPSWRNAITMIVAVPLVVTAIAAMFVSLAVDPQPHAVPLGLVAPPTAAQDVESALAERAGDDAFDIRTQPDAAAARSAIEQREVLGALEIGPAGVRVLTAEAGSPALAQVIAAIGDGIGTAQNVPVTTESVVVPPSTDARGTGFAAGLLPLLIAGMALGAAAALSLAGRIGMQAAVVLLGPIVAGLGFAWVWSGLGVIDGRVVPVALALSLMIGAIAWFVAGAGALLGAQGVGLGAIIMVLVSNPLSGLASSPYLLPPPWGAIGQWLPPGAGGTLTRTVAFFPEASIAGPVWILLAWVALGATMLGLAGLRQRRTA